MPSNEEKKFRSCEQVDKYSCKKMWITDKKRLFVDNVNKVLHAYFGVFCLF